MLNNIKYIRIIVRVESSDFKFDFIVTESLYNTLINKYENEGITDSADILDYIWYEAPTDSFLELDSGNLDYTFYDL